MENLLKRQKKYLKFSKKEGANLKEIINVKGMHCKSCEILLTDKIKELNLKIDSLTKPVIMVQPKKEVKVFKQKTKEKLRSNSARYGMETNMKGSNKKHGTGQIENSTMHGATKKLLNSSVSDISRILIH